MLLRSLATPDSEYGSPLVDPVTFRSSSVEIAWFPSIFRSVMGLCGPSTIRNETNRLFFFLRYLTSTIDVTWQFRKPFERYTPRIESWSPFSNCWLKRPLEANDAVCSSNRRDSRPLLKYLLPSNPIPARRKRSPRDT